MPTRLFRILVVAAAGLAWVVAASGFAFIKNTSTGLPLRWAPGSIPMKVMVNNSTALSDGNTQATAMVAAMQDASRGWNHNLGDAQFVATVAPAANGSDNNGINEVFFSGSPYSMTWDSNTLAVTTAWYIGNQRVEGDTIFNTAFTWDSYRGAKTGNAYDIERVALHEFGHTLGLDHPDDAGQTVSAVMNSHASNVDSLTADDIAGGQSLYGPPGGQPNDNFGSAIPITLSANTATVTGYNTNATKETGEPAHAGNVGGRSVWWKWTAPSNGSMILNTQGSLFDTTLGVYTGSAVNALTTVASNDDIQAGVVQYSSVTFAVASGVTYYFAVDGYNSNDGQGADSAAVTLNLAFTSSGGGTTTSTTSSTTSITSSSTTSTIPPTNGGSGGGGGGGAPGTWFFGALILLAAVRRVISKKG